MDTLEEDDRKAAEVPAALVAHHGPFTWGATARKSLEHAIVCEAVADIAIHTLNLAPAGPPPRHLLERHHTRRHGPDACYGNPEIAVSVSG